MTSINNEIDLVDKGKLRSNRNTQQHVANKDKVVNGDLIPADVIPESHVKSDFRPFYTMSEDQYEREEKLALALASALENGSQLGGDAPSKQTSTILASHADSQVLHSETSALQTTNSEGVIISGFGEERDKNLAKVEVIMRGDLYTMTLFWRAAKKEVFLVLRHVFDK